MLCSGTPVNKAYGEYVEGSLLKDSEEYAIVVDCRIEDGTVQDWHIEPIEPNSLRYKIGDEWFTEDELEFAVQNAWINTYRMKRDIDHIKKEAYRDLLLMQMATGYL